MSLATTPHSTLQTSNSKKGVPRLRNNKISSRWFFNNLIIVIALIVASTILVTLLYRRSLYTSIKQVLVGRSEEIYASFQSKSDTEYSADDFEYIGRSYIQNFSDKSKMEVMLISVDGKILLSSSGFAPDKTDVIPDFNYLLNSDKEYACFEGVDDSQKVIAVTRPIHSKSGKLIGAVRYVVSTEGADKSVMRLIGILFLAGILIIALITMMGLYFIRSIVVPIKKITASAKTIADGDFDVRIEKERNDEIGLLTDTINEMAAELGTTEKLKNDFISSISHELRTPLTAITGWAQTLDGSTNSPETVKRGMNIIVKESERLTGLVDELLDFSRLETGRMKLILQKTDIIAELDEVYFMFTERAKNEKKKLSFSDEGYITPVICDTNRMRQVFINVIDNAIKYSEEGDSIIVSAFERGNNAVVVVRDTGIGIPEEHLPNVKKKFYKANLQIKGSGIGLAVADEIVNLHGGSLTVTSKEGEGTEVTISLPTVNSPKSPQI